MPTRFEFKSLGERTITVEVIRAPYKLGCSSCAAVTDEQLKFRAGNRLPICPVCQGASA